MHAPQISVSGLATYRADIDGMRAIAVLSVLAYHYSAPFPWPLLPGGFTGVDVFFVISGFLITSRIMDDIRAGTFTIMGFYDRRIRRILPALFVMLVASLVAAWFLLLPGDYATFAASAAAAIVGGSNFFFLENTGYFDRAADLMPLLHTWSLGIEEQFYLIWPIALFAIAAGRSGKHRTLFLTVSVIVVAGFIESLFWFFREPQAAFYLPVPRAWELAIGAAFVFVPPLNRPYGEGAAWAGLALIVTGFFLASPSSFPGFMALLPCVGAGLIIWPRGEPTRTGRALGRLAPLGLISYSLYLWHWPVWVFYRIYINNAQPRIREALVLAAISMVLAMLSYRLVERPFRKPYLQPVFNVGIGLGFCTTLVCAALTVHGNGGFPSRVSSDATNLRGLQVMWDWDCKTRKNFEALPPSCTFGAPWTNTNDKAILWGDSNAEQFTPFFDHAAKAANVSVATLFGCPAILDGQTVQRREPTGFGPNYNEQCGTQRQIALETLKQRADIKVVILAASWSYLLPKLGASLEQGPELFEFALRDIISKITSAGKKVALIAPIPQWAGDPVPCALLNVGLVRRPCADSEMILTRKWNTDQQSASLSILRRVTGEFRDARLIVPADGLCQTEQCLTRIRDEFIYRDGVHFRRNLSEETNREVYKLIGFDGIFR